MAHANPEFALGLMKRDHAPVSHEARDVPTLGNLRARMRQIGELIDIDYPVSDAERQAYRLWQTQVRRDRQNERRDLTTSLNDGPGMHAGEPKGIKFVPPVRRGEGRTKRWQLS